MKKIPLCVAAAALAFGAQAVVYLKPLGAEETRSTVDGTSWATAYTTVQEAVDAIADDGCADKTIHAAKGVYYITANVSNLPADFRFYGCFAGESESETLAGRDLANDQTVFTSDTAGTRYWIKWTPTLGAHASVETKLTDRKCIVDGKVCLPPAWGEGDDFAAYGVSANSIDAFSIAATSYGTFDGIRFIGFTRVLNYASGNSTDPSSLANCAIYGCVASGGDTFHYARTAPLTLTDVEISYGYSFWHTAGLGSSSSSLAMTRVSFVGNRIGGSGDDQGYVCTVSQASMDSCLFTHNLVYIGNNGGVALFGSSGTVSLRDTVVTNNYTSCNTCSEGAMLVSAKKGTFTDCLFADNRAEVTVKADLSTTLFGFGYPGNVYTDIENTYDRCVFARNVLAAVRDDGSSGAYALGIVGHGKLWSYFSSSTGGATERLQFCVFDDNVVSGLESETLTGTLSRGVVMSAAHSVCNLSVLSVTNCTFTGASSVPAGVVDVAQFGGYLTKNLSVVNSVFAGASMPDDSFSFPSPSLVTLADCHVKDRSVAPEGVATSGLYLDDVPLNDDYEPTVRAPGLAEIVPFGGATIRGAIQTVNQPAGTFAVAVRHEPFDYGTFGDVATTVAVGSDEISYTATAQGGSTFAGWYYPNGTIFSESATIALSTENISADTVLTARFETPKVTVTFDLGEGATFASTGLSVSNLQLAAQSAFPAAPTDIVVKDGWYRVPDVWTPTLPSVVPSEDAVYVARIVTKQVRVVRYDSHATGTGDGTSWANAYTDFAAALADAQTYRGEVWVKGGVHFISPISSTVHSVNDGMAIRGGYLGDDGDDAARDVAGHPSVLTGDLKGDDCFRAYGRTREDLGIKQDGSGNTLLVMNADGSFNTPVCADDERYFIVQNTSDNVSRGFLLVAAGPDAGAATVFDGLTLTGFAGYTIDNGTSGVPFITNCTFRGRQYVSALNGVRVADSRFIGGDSGRGYAANAGILYVAASAVCERVTFDTLTTEYGGAYRIYNCHAVARDCVFRDVRQFGTATGYGSCVAIATGSGCLENCLFERCDSFGAGPVVSVGGINSVLSNCLFRSCRLDAWVGTSSMNQAAVLAGIGSYAQAHSVSFVSNVVSSCGTKDAQGNDIVNRAHVVSLGGDTSFVNGTFVSNEATAQGAAENVASVIRATGETYGGVADTTFLDNVAANGTYCEHGRTSGSPWIFAGCLVWSRDGVAPFTRFAPNSATTGVKVYNSVVRNFSSESETVLECAGVVTADPKVDPVRMTFAGTLASVRPPSTSSAAFAGTSVFYGERTVHPSHASWTYRPLYVNRGTRDAPSYLNLVTTSVESSPTLVGELADILGGVRRKGRPTCGSTEAAPLGFMLIVK